MTVETATEMIGMINAICISLNDAKNTDESKQQPLLDHIYAVQELLNKTIDDEITGIVWNIKE